LDVGCGTDALFNQLAKTGVQITGIDMSYNMVEQEKKKYPTLSFCVLDVYDFNQVAEYDVIF